MIIYTGQTSGSSPNGIFYTATSGIWQTVWLMHAIAQCMSFPCVAEQNKSVLKFQAWFVRNYPQFSPSKLFLKVFMGGIVFWGIGQKGQISFGPFLLQAEG